MEDEKGLFLIRHIREKDWRGKESVFYWESKVKDTLSKKRRRSFFENNFFSGGPSFRGDHFAVGDRVSFGEDEGIVNGIHRYQTESAYDEKYLVRVHFGGELGNLVVPAEKLKVLTCENVPFDRERKYVESLENIFKFKDGVNPLETDLRAIFENDISRAVWVAYRTWHMMDENSLANLKYFAESVPNDIQYFLENNSLDRLHIFFKHELFGKARIDSNGMEDGLIAALVPYLNREKIVCYEVDGEIAC